MSADDNSTASTDLGTSTTFSHFSPKSYPNLWTIFQRTDRIYSKLFEKINTHNKSTKKINPKNKRSKIHYFDGKTRLNLVISWFRLFFHSFSPLFLLSVVVWPCCCAGIYCNFGFGEHIHIFQTYILKFSKYFLYLFLHTHRKIDRNHPCHV